MLLVDGNNVMGQRPGWHRDRRGAQLRLLNELADLARLNGIQSTAVFDGRPLPSFPDGSRFRGVTVYYATRGSDADSRIVEIVEQEPNRTSLIVVTSDARLRDRVRIEGVRTVPSGHLRRLLDALPASEKGQSEEPHEPTEAEVSSWMRYFGVDKSDDEK